MQQHVTASVDKGGSFLGSKLENRNKPGLFILLINSLYPGYFRRTRGRLRVCWGCILFHTFSCDSLKRVYALIEGHRDPGVIEITIECVRTSTAPIQKYTQVREAGSSKHNWCCSRHTFSRQEFVTENLRKILEHFFMQGISRIISSFWWHKKSIFCKIHNLDVQLINSYDSSARFPFFNCFHPLLHFLLCLQNIHFLSIFWMIINSFFDFPK